MLILGLETSCDETAAAVIRAEKDRLSVLSNAVASQISLHARWGGVVPNLAAREHLKNILPVLQASLRKAGVTWPQIDLLAVTNGPGLIPALLIGTGTAKALAFYFQKPLLGIHHIEGHIYANFIGRPKGQVKFPVLCLVVSGGHTQLILMKKHLSYALIGETLDDAAGEAFDKVARILNLGYPGGPAVAAMAAKAPHLKSPLRDFPLPRPMINSANFAFSFSGLKTAVLYAVKKNPKILKDQALLAGICAEFQQAVVDVLVAKTLKAAEKYRPSTIMLAGGVSANRQLRDQLGKAVKKLKNTDYRIPALEYSVDNAAMLAAAGHFRWKNLSVRGRSQAMHNWKKLKTDANLKLA